MVRRARAVVRRALAVAGAALVGLVCLMAVLGGVGVAQSDEARGIVSRAGSPVPAQGRSCLCVTEQGSPEICGFRGRCGAAAGLACEPRGACGACGSRMAFHGLSGAGAERLLSGAMGRWSPGECECGCVVARSGRVVRYLGDYEAVVRGAHGLRIERSTTPLRLGIGTEKRPVDLTLQATGGAYVPMAPVAGVSIARDSAGGVAVGSSGLRVTLEGAPVAGAPVAAVRASSLALLVLIWTRLLRPRSMVRSSLRCCGRA